MKILFYKRASFLLAAIAGVFVVQCSWFAHKPEVPEELLKKFS